MEISPLEQAAELLEKANADLCPELCSKEQAKHLLLHYSRVEKLAAFGKAVLSARVGEAAEVARLTGTSMGRARLTLEIGGTLERAPQLSEALRHARISLDQAAEIAKTEAVSPGSAEYLLDVASHEAFHVLQHTARELRLEAQAGPGLADRQHEARALHHRVTDLGMIRIEADLEPHIGIPLVNRLEDQARHLARSTGGSCRPEPFERHLADALPALLAGASGGRPGRPELIVLVSYEVARRGWHDVRDHEKCAIPGIGPITPRIAKEIAADAFLSGLFYDGKDLRHLKRWTRSIPAEVRLALQLGEPPRFDGLRCVDCGNRYQLEMDHLEPHAAGGTASTDNIQARCRSCHRRKTTADREAGKLRPHRNAGRAPP